VLVAIRPGPGRAGRPGPDVRRGGGLLRGVGVAAAGVLVPEPPVAHLGDVILEQRLCRAFDQLVFGVRAAERADHSVLTSKRLVQHADFRV